MALITGACATSPINVGVPMPTLSVKSISFYDDTSGTSTTPITAIPSYSSKIRAVVVLTNTGSSSTNNATITMKNQAGVQLGMQNVAMSTGDITATFGYVTGTSFGAATYPETTYKVSFYTSGTFTNTPLAFDTNVTVFGYVELSIVGITTTPSTGVITGNTVSIKVTVKNTGNVPFVSAAYPNMKAWLKYTKTAGGTSFTPITGLGVAMPSNIAANGGTSDITYSWQLTEAGSIYICCDIKD